MTIRPATKQDIASIRQIAHETWPVAYAQILATEQLDYMLGLMYNDAALGEQFDQGHHFFIAESDDSEAIGFAGTSEIVPGKTWKLHKLYVLPGIQKSGAGKALLQAVVDIAKQHQATELSLNVNRNNPAYHYYLKNGFQVAETVDIPIGGGFFMNDFIMKRPI